MQTRNRGRRTSRLIGGGGVVQTSVEFPAQVGVEPDVVVGKGERDEGRDVQGGGGLLQMGSFDAFHLVEGGVRAVVFIVFGLGVGGGAGWWGWWRSRYALPFFRVLGDSPWNESKGCCHLPTVTGCNPLKYCVRHT